MNKKEQKTIKLIRKTFKTPEAKKLLTPYWREQNKNKNVHSVGFCYIATEALFHMLGGKNSGYKPVCISFPIDFYVNRPNDPVIETHWWLVNKEGKILDPTIDQIKKDIDIKEMYKNGICKGFQNGYKKPSKRAQKLIELALS
jgi:hypothetical protein